MRNVSIDLNNHVAKKTAAAVVSLTDPSDVARPLKAFEYALKHKKSPYQNRL
jgi:hypothetical protein